MMRAVPVPARIALLLLGVTGFVVGVWALFFPLGFYEAFPGCGRTWIALDGPYNEHLVRDVGGLNLGMGVLAGLALLRPASVAPWTVGAATLAYNLPHLVYHLATLGLYPPLDRAGNVAGLGAALLASLVLLLTRPGRVPRAAASASLQP